MPLASRTLAAVIAALTLVGLRAVVPSQALAGDPCYHGFELPQLSVAAGPDVKAMPCAFAPTVTTVPVGGTVTFYNGRDAHLITGANQGWGSRDMELAPNASVSYTFPEAGIYPYACALHRGMSGAIVVGDGGPALALAFAGLAPERAGSTGDAVSAGEDEPAGSARVPSSIPAIPLAAGVALTAAVLLLAALAWRAAHARGARKDVTPTPPA